MRIMKKISLILFIALGIFILSGSSVSAHPATSLCVGGPNDGQPVPPHAESQTNHTYVCNNSLANPLGGAGTLQQVIARIVGGLYIFAIPIASIFILWGAFQMLMSRGEMEKIKQGKRTITYAIIGLILMLLASGAGYIINNILSSP